MRVQKRNGQFEEVKFDKITSRIAPFCEDLSIDPVGIAQKIVARIHNNITTIELDDLTCQLCAGMSLIHPDYQKLASRICINNHQKNTSDKYSNVVLKLQNNKDVLGNPCPLLSKELTEIVLNNSDTINNMIDYDRDYNIDFFGFKTLERAYLMHLEDKTILERPQHMWLRVALGIHGNNLSKVKETYDFLSQGYFTHATPTLFHAGTPRAQLSSCFLHGTSDSVHGIYDSIKRCAIISKWAGGIGVHISNIRAAKSYIRGTNGVSNGLMPMLKVYNDTARYIDQGGGRRKGSFAMYLEPWHADVFEFLDARKPHGSDSERARDLFYALWIPDLFMKRVKEDGVWSLMCPDTSKGLSDVYGEEFDKLYCNYEEKGKFVRQIKAQELWKAIIDAQIETGTPYMLYKDACNKKSNQKNIGTIKSSNLCVEIIEYSDDKEVAVCNLASIALPKFIKKGNILDNTDIIIYTKSNCNYCSYAKKILEKYSLKSFKIIPMENEDERKKFYKSLGEEYDTYINTMPQIFRNNILIGGFDDLLDYIRPQFDFQKLYEVTRAVTYNLNEVIDKNFYPLPEAEKSNLKHRPMGIGVQGLADVFQIMKLPYDSDDSKKLNKQIFETMYFASLSESLKISKSGKGPYKSFKGSPLSQGIFQFELWDGKTELMGLWDWDKLRTDIMEYGVHNSLFLALMPTASTAQILGNNESFEPYTSNLYTRRTLAGEFTILNKHLMKDLIDFGLWNEEMRDKLMYHRGSVQLIPEIPRFLKEIYKTSWELSQKQMINMSADRGQFIDQSQSFNVFVKNVNFDILSKIHFYGWSKGLKTGTYYIRSKASTNSQRFTIDPKKEKQYEEEGCLMCSG